MKNRAEVINSKAVTLVEMMIVLFIMALLAVAALRALPGEDDRVSEAARMVDLYLGTARNRAIGTGRPAGVIFQRFQNHPEACTVLQQCEVPPPYAGDTLNARAIVYFDNAGVLYAELDQSPPPEIVKVGDTIKFDYKGLRYNIIGINNTVLQIVPIGNFSALPWIEKKPLPEQQPIPVSYQIFRQPVKSAISPLQLPTNTAVDLAYSGVAPSNGDGYFARNNIADVNPFILIFSTNGSVEGLYRSVNGIYQFSRNVNPTYLLIGRFDKIPRLIEDSNGIHYEALPQTPTENQYPNWCDLNNSWITIQAQTGHIAITDVHPLTRSHVDWTEISEWPYVPIDWREFITISRSFGD